MLGRRRPIERGIEYARVEAARTLMWSDEDPRECVDCGEENPREAPCCGVCGGDLSGER